MGSSNSKRKGKQTDGSKSTDEDLISKMWSTEDMQFDSDLNDNYLLRRQGSNNSKRKEKQIDEWEFSDEDMIPKKFSLEALGSNTDLNNNYLFRSLGANNLKRRGKHTYESELGDEDLTSKKGNIFNTWRSLGSISVGAVAQVLGNATITYRDITVVNQQQPTEQPSVQQPQTEKVSGIELQMADPVVSFCGRSADFEAVKRAFNKQTNNKCNLVAVCGYGGIGKTQFARMYIKKYRRVLQNTIWIHAESEATMKDSFNQLQGKLNDNGFRCYNQQDVYEHIDSNLSIFIFDNSENIRSIQSFLPEKRNKSMFLITSRSKNWDTFLINELNELELKDAENIMKAVLVKKHNIQISDTQLKKLSNSFERIPLVLQINAGFISQKVSFLDKIGSKFNVDDIIEELNAKHDYITEKFHDFILDPYDKSVFAAVYQTLEKILNEEDEDSKTAAEMLGISAYLYADFIYEDIFKYLLHFENVNLFNNALDILDQYSLFQVSDSIIRIHRTVQQCLQYHHREIIKSKKYYLQALSLLLNNDLFSVMHHETIWKHGEIEIESLYTFYENTKFHEDLIESTPFNIVEHLLNKSELIRNPQFLCQAAAIKREDIIQLLQNRNADFNIKDGKGFGAIHYVCLLKNDDITYLWDTIEFLIGLGVDVNSQNSSGCTVLHTLCKPQNHNSRKDHDVFNASALLIKLGANPEIRNNACQTPADLAREFGLQLSFELLHSVFPGGRNLPHIVAKSKQFDLLHSLIIDRDFHINELDDSGSTVVHILAGLVELDPRGEEKLLNITAELLLKYSNADISIMNNAGEMAEDVARRCGREHLADFLNSEIPPGRIVYNTAVLYNQIKRFRFVRNKNIEYVNEQDDSGCTFLHTLCNLDSQGNIELELDIVKLAAHLVILYNANVCIRNKENDTAADVARRREHHLLADLLVDTQDFKDEMFLLVAVKHKNSYLIKYVWWKYLNWRLPQWVELSHYKTVIDCHVVRMFCELEDSTVTDTELISFLDYFDLKQLGKDEYHEAAKNARQHGRGELAAWLQARS